MSERQDYCLTDTWLYFRRETVVYDSVQDPRVPDLSGDQLQVSASDHCLRARDQDQNDVISIFGFQKSNHVFITGKIDTMYNVSKLTLTN